MIKMLSRYHTTILLLLGLNCAEVVHSFALPSFPFRPGTRLSSSLEDTCDVAVIGGGFGGLYTALALSRLDSTLDIALVEPTSEFVFLPLLYDLTVGTATEAEVCPAYRDLLEGTNVRQVFARLDSLETGINNDDNQCVAQLQPATPQSPTKLNAKATVVAVGASPTSILDQIPGATHYAQPFYTSDDAKATRRLLSRLEENGNNNARVAVVGGGFGGVELAASVKRRLPSAEVTLLSRGPPMAGTRAEPLVDKALQKLGVQVELSSVEALRGASAQGDVGNNILLLQPVVIERTQHETKEPVKDSRSWDVVLWTAGSRPTFPVSNGLEEFRKTESERLAVDSSLRCFLCEDKSMVTAEGEERRVKTVKFQQPPVWALGDCAELVALSTATQPAVPKTAQAAMQQSDVVANNVLAYLQSKPTTRTFIYQDLGSMATLGGPNAAVMAPSEGALAPIFAPLIDSASTALSTADRILEATVGKSPLLEKCGMSPYTMGLSLGSHGLGVSPETAPGTLAGTLTGAARRAVYAARMPTNRQRAVAAASAAISTAASLVKEVATSSSSSNRRRSDA